MQAVKIGWVGQTFAMARCNETHIKGKRTRNRIKKEERKSLVETFINKYREENGGSFPSLSSTHREVGGSFYTVREIVRELIQENRVLASGSSHSQVLNLEYSEDRAQLPLGSLSLEPASTSMVEINGHEVHEIRETHIENLHTTEESEKFHDKTTTVSRELTAIEDTDTTVGCEQDIVTSLQELSEKDDVVFASNDKLSFSDAKPSTGNMQVAILDCDPLDRNIQMDSMHHDLSRTKSTGNIDVEQLAVQKSVSGSSISDSVFVDQGEYPLVTEVKTKATSLMGLEESDSREISMLDNKEQTEIDKSEVEDLQDGLSDLNVTGDLLSSFNSALSMNYDSRLKLEDEGNVSGTSFESENGSVIEEERADHLATRPPLSLDEFSQTRNVSSNIVTEEVGTSIGESVPDVSNNHPPHTENKVQLLHASVDDSLKNPVAINETAPEQLSSHIKSVTLSDGKPPSSVKATGSPLSDVKSDSSKGTTSRPRDDEDINPFVSAIKKFFKAIVDIFMGDKF